MTTTTTTIAAAHPRSQPLRGKTALITGAASGLGASLSRVLGECGASVVGVDIQPTRLADGIAALRERGIDARGLSADISDPQGAARAVAAAAAISGRLDILVNNAGTDLTVPLGELSDADWQRIIGTNLSGPFLLSRAALPYMRGQAGAAHLHNGLAHAGHMRQGRIDAGQVHAGSLHEGPAHAARTHDEQLPGGQAKGDRMPGRPLQDGRAGAEQDRAKAALARGEEYRGDQTQGEHVHGGHIVNIASTAAKRAWPNASAYHASKWGLLGFSHALHAELRSQGIRVTAVVAGGMRTPFLLERFPELDAASLQDPDDVAGAILSVLLLPPNAVVAELTILPLRETSWP